MFLRSVLKSIFCPQRASLVAMATLFISLSAAGQTAHAPKQSHLELRSSDQALVRSFEWAKKQALDYVNEGDPVGPWYEAALPGRHAFCMRDVSHQVAGAHALGLSAYSYNMLHKFAQNISASRDWCSYWEIDAKNHPAPVDYRDDATFWYNLPANFDVLDASYRMYLWTGNDAYLNDADFVNFYRRTMNEYIERWDLGQDKIMTRDRTVAPPPFFRGDPTYEESRSDIMAGADLLATQYAAHRSYAAIAALRGEQETAKAQLQLADSLKQLVNTKWWNASAGSYFAFLDKQHRLQGRSAADLLYRGITEKGVKTAAAMAALRESVRSTPEESVEPATYFAETLYRYGAAQEAYGVILDLTHPGRKRQEYPEVSYSVVGAIASGMMGVNVRPTVHESVRSLKNTGFQVETLPQLASSTAWAELRHLPLRSGAVSVRHDGNRKTSLTNEGSSPLNWRACFQSSHVSLYVNGKRVAATRYDNTSELEKSCVVLPVAPGSTAVVRLP